jgi:hypothetical protein
MENDTQKYSSNYPCLSFMLLGHSKNVEGALKLSELRKDQLLEGSKID